MNPFKRGKGHNKQAQYKQDMKRWRQKRDELQSMDISHLVNCSRWRQLMRDLENDKPKRPK